MTDKDILRRKCLERRDAMSDAERRQLSHKIVENIRRSEAYKNAESIMIYKVFRSEADLTELEAFAAEDGKLLSFPYCTDRSSMLALHPLSADAFAEGRYGISAPIPESSAVVEPEDIDLVICPCLGFDGTGARLGTGAGYYDRFLPKCKNARIALAAFELQRLEYIPTEPHDVGADIIYTDTDIQ